MPWLSFLRDLAAPDRSVRSLSDEQTKRAAQATQIAKAIQERVQVYGEIGKAICASATYCHRKSSFLGSSLSKTDRPTHEMYAFNEYIFFFWFITRLELGSSLNEKSFEEVNDYLERLIPDVAIDAYMEHWPAEVKQKIIGEFKRNFGKAEAEYLRVAADASIPAADRVFPIFIEGAAHVVEAYGAKERWHEVKRQVTEQMLEQWRQTNYAAFSQKLG